MARYGLKNLNESGNAPKIDPAEIITGRLSGEPRTRYEWLRIIGEMQKEGLIKSVNPKNKRDCIEITLENVDKPRYEVYHLEVNYNYVPGGE